MKLRRIPSTTTYLIMRAGSSFLFALMFSVIILYYITGLRLDPFQLVLVGTALEVTIFLFEVPTGIVADVYSRRLSVIIGVALIGVAHLVIGFIPTYAAVLIGQVLWGLGETFTSGATEAWLADEIGEAQAADVYLRAAQLGAVTGIAGIITGAVLGSFVLRVPLILGAALFVGLAIFLALAMTETGFKPKARTTDNPLAHMRATLLDGVKVVRARPVLLTILAISVVFGAFSEGYDRLNQKHVLENVGLPGIPAFEPVVWFSLITIVAMLLGMLAASVTRRRLDLNDPARVARALALFSGVLSLAVIGFGLVQNFWLAASLMWTIALLRTVREPLTIAWLNQHIDSEVRATVLSMNGQADALGEMAVGPAIGAMGSAFGLRPTLVIAGLLLTPALWLYGRALRHTEAKNTP